MSNIRKVFCTKKGGIVEILNNDDYSKGLKGTPCAGKKYESCQENNCSEFFCKYSTNGIAAQMVADMIGGSPPDALIDPLAKKEGCFIATATKMTNFKRVHPKRVAEVEEK